MKKTALILGLILIVIPAASADISVRIRGGLSFISPADYNDGAEGQNAYVAFIAAHAPEGGFGTFGSGWTISGEAILPLSPNFSLGLGSGFLRFATTSRIAYQYPTTSPTLLFGGATDINASIGAVPVVLKVHYARPIAGAVSFTAGLGAGAYFCSFDHRSEFIGGYMGATDWNETQTFASRKIALGLEGEIGLEIPLTKKVFAEINVGGRLARLSDVEGDWTDAGVSDRGAYSSGGSDGFFSVWDYAPGNGRTYRFATFDSNLRPGQPNFRKGVLDLSGIVLTCGLRFVL